MADKNLEYWKDRKAQISWRLGRVVAVVERLENDIRKYDEEIKKFKSQFL